MQAVVSPVGGFLGGASMCTSGESTLGSSPSYIPMYSFNADAQISVHSVSADLRNPRMYIAVRPLQGCVETL